MSFNWREHFPYREPREIQAETLRTLVENWNNYEVFIVSAPTGYGKSALATTLMRALKSVSVITPTNLLVNQYLEEFPDTPTLRRLDSYYCEKWDRPCPVTRSKMNQFCNRRRDDIQCPCSGDLSTALYRKGPGIYNYHVYSAHKLYRDVLVVDEAHNLIPFLRDRAGQTIWQHDYKYLSNMYSPEQISDWLRTLRPNQLAHKKIALLKDFALCEHPTHIVQRTTAEFNGKGTVRGEPEERDCIRLLPVDISDMGQKLLWPGLGRGGSGIRKLVLMSATIGPKDIEALGLEGRRVIYLDCRSPIPPTNRPIVTEDLVSVNRASMDTAVPRLASRIDEIAEEYPGQKGVIHCTYQLSGLLRRHLTGDRYMFHGRADKREQYLRFRESDPAEGRILVACGMYEGIDLPEDLGRFQVIAKVPWLSLANPAVRYMSEKDPEWYSWECLRALIQACGRICRTPTDWGITYILDSSLERLFQTASHMMPDWWTDALVKFSEESTDE